MSVVWCPFYFDIGGVSKIELFKLWGSIFVDSAEAEKSIAKTDEKVESFGTKLGKGIKTAAKWGAALGAGAAVVGAGMMKMATNSAETTDRIDKLSQKIGLSRQGFQELDFITSQSGMSIENLQGGFKALTNSIDQAANGTGKGAKSFAALGISVKDANGNIKDQETVFNEAVLALQNMEEGTEKAKLANDLFGRSGSEMMPLLNGAAGSMEEMRKQAHELGLVMSDESIDAGVAFTDTMDQLKRSFQTAVSEIGVKFMPLITKFADFIMANMPMIQSTISTVFSVLSSAVETAITGISKVVDWFRMMATVFKENSDIIVPALVAMAAVIFGTMIPAWVASASAAISSAIATALAFAPVTLAIAAVGLAVAGLALIWRKWGDDIKRIVGPVVDAVVAWFRDMLKWAVETTKDIVTKVKVAFDLMKENIKTALETAMTIITTVLGYWKNTFDNVMSFLKALVKGDFEGMKNAIKSQMENASQLITTIWNGIKSYFSTVLSNILTTVVKTFTDVVNRVKEKMDNVLSAISGGFTDALDFIKGVGADFFNAGANIIGMVADGIKSAVSKVTDAIGGVMGKVRDFLPFSPAKVGPLKTIDKLDFGGPISDSIKNAIPKVNEMMGKLLSMPGISVSTEVKSKSADEIGKNGLVTGGLESRLNVGTSAQSSRTDEKINQLIDAIHYLSLRPVVLKVDGRTIAEASYDDISKMMFRDVRQSIRTMGGLW